MRALDKKLFRDVWEIRGQALAIALVMASGIATFVMSLNTIGSLTDSQTSYYNRYRFAEVFANLKRAPDTLRARLAEIPGVAQVQTRIVVNVTLDVPDMEEPAIGRIISVPDFGEPRLNHVYLRQGRYLSPGRQGEVLVSEGFANAHQLELGDHVSAVINGKLQRLHIVGVALCPEYLISIAPGGLLPDDRRFGVFWMGHSELSAAFNMEGAFNDANLSLIRGANEADVIDQVDALLKPFGGVGAYGRKDQISHHYISDEILQLRTMSVVAPSIFLSVSAFLLNVVISRIVSTQREQIAALKAFGYSRWEIGLHYLKQTLLIVAVGAVLGILGGSWFGIQITALYAEFYRFPVFHFRLNPAVVVLSLLVSFAAATGATLLAVLRAVNLPPAEAMRPAPPTSYRPTILERLGVGRYFPQTTRMILRQLERRPAKSLLSCVGIAFAGAVIVLGAFMHDSVTYLMHFQFNIAQRQDLTVTFVEATSQDATYAMHHLPGVTAVESFRSVPTKIHFQHRSRRVGIMGLESDADMYRLIDYREREVAIPPEGLLLSNALANALEVQVGDRVTVEVLEGKRMTAELPVNGLVTEFSGMNAYMNLRSLQRFIQDGQTISGVFVGIDDHHVSNLYRELKQTPQVAGVGVRSSMLQSFWDTIAKNMMTMRAINLMFACIIAVGVVYNTARISLAERSREFATLRVIGFTRGEVSAILLGELVTLTLVAIPIGWFIGYLLASGMLNSMDTELYRFPLVISNKTFALSALVVLGATVASGLIVRRQIDHLDLVAVLKSKE